MQVYLPDALYERVKAEGSRLNVSGVLQEALTEHLAALERRDALGAAVDAHLAESGPLSTTQLDRQEEADRAATVYPPRRNRRTPAA